MTTSPPTGAGSRWSCSRRRSSSSCSTPRSSTSRCRRSATRCTSPRTTCRGSSTPTRSPSAASCCSAGGWPTCSAAGACSSPASILFAGASLAGGLAQSDVWLIAARAVQGLGAALLSPAALSLVTTIFAEGAERNKALGVWGAVAGSGGAAGVLLGGMLTEWAGWEWVLFVNVPIGIAAAFLAPRLLPESRNEGAPPLRHRRRAHGHRRPVAARLLAGQRQLGRLGLARDARPARASRSRCSSRFVLIERRTRAPLVPFPGIFRCARSAASTSPGC